MKYYQMNNQEPSFAVWKSYEQCIIDNNCQKIDIRAYEDDNIEAPRFMDIDIYHDKEIELFLLHKVMHNEIDEVRSFLEINQKDFKHGMTHFLNYICTDEDTEQYLKKVSENVLFVIEKNQFHTISLHDYSTEELEDMVTTYYDGGIDQVKKEYGNKWRQIVAEIVAECQ